MPTKDRPAEDSVTGNGWAGTLVQLGRTAQDVTFGPYPQVPIYKYDGNLELSWVRPQHPQEGRKTFGNWVVQHCFFIVGFRKPCIVDHTG